MSENYQYPFSVIIPVYNVEKYLEETVDSVIAQTIGFEDNIQIIFVNDGSPDNSQEICLKYREKYPNNIVCVTQENAGVSAARNTGIAYIKGKYVNFLDSDDCWQKDAFEHLYQFFEEHYDETDVVAARKQFFDARTGYHYLDYKFESTRLVDLKSDFECIQLDVTGAIIKASAIGKHRFSTKLKYGEDAQFINGLILERCTLGVVREAVHLYRKRSDDSSALQNEMTSPSYYFDSPVYFHRALFELSKAKYGQVQKFIQYTVMYDIGWRIRKKQVRQYLSKEDFDRYCELLVSLMKQMDNDVILKQHYLWKKHKIYCMLKKRGRNTAARLFCKVSGVQIMLEDS